MWRRKNKPHPRFWFIDTASEYEAGLPDRTEIRFLGRHSDGYQWRKCGWWWVRIDGNEDSYFLRHEVYRHKLTIWMTQAKFELVRPVKPIIDNLDYYEEKRHA